MAGDLNAVRSSETIKQFARHWKIAGDEEQPTHPAGKPRRQIDFILLRPQQRWRTRSVQIIDEPTASDHRPVLAVVELLAEGPSEK